MAAFFPKTENSANFTPHKERFNRVFQPIETLDHPCDVTLVFEDGKEFKAHKDVLSEASPFFEKLLNSDMKESKEGVVRLEMFNESVMAAALEFIYTGKVQILSQEMAESLIVMADYLSFPRLKIQAEEIVMEELDVTNCISTFNFAERYQCEVLVLKATEIIAANFSTLLKTEKKFLMNLSNMYKEVEMLISSDGIDVSAEENVFKFIVAWIKHDKSKRKKYFAELFRHVRLVFVSRDFLTRDVVTNNLVKDSDGCLNLVKDAVHFIDSTDHHNLFVRPRRFLETAAMVFVNSADKHILGYFPREDKLCRLGELFHNSEELFGTLVPCHGKLYIAHPSSQQLLCYDPFSNTWRSRYTDERKLWQIFVRNENEMYALVSEPWEGTLYITKYKPESNSWEADVPLKCEMMPLSISLQKGMCIVAKDSFIYFIGGNFRGTLKGLRNVYRYDLNKDQVDKLADLQVERNYAYGASAHGKVFVAGGINEYHSWSKTCEVYDETTNQWHFIAGWRMPHNARPSCKILSADDKLYSVVCLHGSDPPETRIECYDPEKDEWNEVAKMPLHVNAEKARGRHLEHALDYPVRVNACSMRVFKGFLSNASVQEAHVIRRRKCLIL
ncbi:kelch-like protein 28 [Oculina patagonica]